MAGGIAGVAIGGGVAGKAAGGAGEPGEDGEDGEDGDDGVAGPPGPAGRIGDFLLDAATRLGVAIGTLTWMHRSFVLEGPNTTSGNGGSVLYPTTTNPRGCVIIKGASSSYQWALNGPLLGANLYPPAFQSTQALRWYVAAYFSLTTATVVASASTATVLAGVGGAIPGSAPAFMMGAAGSISTANYAAYFTTGSGINSGTPLDTSVFHLHKCWRDVTAQNTYYQVDANTPVAAGMESRPGSICPLVGGVTDSDNRVSGITLAEWFFASALP